MSYRGPWRGLGSVSVNSWTLVGGSDAAAILNTTNDGTFSSYLEAPSGSDRIANITLPNAVLGEDYFDTQLAASNPYAIEWEAAYIKVGGGTPTLNINHTSFPNVAIGVTLTEIPSPLPLHLTPRQASFNPVSQAVFPNGVTPGGTALRFYFLRWRLVTYRRPLAPTVHTPATTTLTPAITGVTNDPDGDAHTDIRFEVRRVSDNHLMWDHTHSFGQFEAGRINGTTFNRPYGGSALSNGVAYKVRAQTKDADGDWGDWSAFVEWTPNINVAPTATAIAPAAGAQVGTLSPTFSVGFSDPNAGDKIGSWQIRVFRKSDNQQMWDSGLQPSTGPEQTAARVDKVYGVVGSSTPLSATVEYEWEARVGDLAGLLSPYTARRSVTPVTAPNPPTLTSPAGLTNTLTPTIQGTYNQGTGSAEAGYYYEVREGAVLRYQSGLVAGAIGTGQAYGTDNPSDTPSSPPALQWGRSHTVRAKSRDDLGQESDWSASVAFNTNAAPTTPTNLTPNGAVTGNRFPTLSWQHNDPDGDAQEEVKIWLKEVGGSFVSGYDPKTLAQSTTTHQVTEELDDSPTDYEWWCTTRGTSGPGHSPEPDHRFFTVASGPSMAITAPAPDAVLTSPGHTVEFTLSGGSGIQQDYRIREYAAADPNNPVFDTGVVAGTAAQVVVSGGHLVNGGSWLLRVTGRDTLDQPADSGLQAFSTAWEAPATIEGLQVLARDGEGVLPHLEVFWQPSDHELASWLRYELFRRPVAAGEPWVRIARLTSQDLISYQDFTVAAGQAYEYVVIQVVMVGSEEVASDFPTSASSQVDFEDVFIHQLDVPSNFVQLPPDSLRVGVVPQVGYVRAFSATYGVAHTSPGLNESFELMKDEAHWTFEADDQVRRLSRLIASQGVGGRFCVRNYRGVRAFVQFDSTDTEHRFLVAGLGVQLRRVDHQEEV